MHVAKRDREFIRVDVELFGKKLRDFLQRAVQIAVVVERVDQRSDDLPIAQRELELRKLTQQMIAQRICGDLLRKEAVVIVGSACAAPVGIAG